MALGPPVRWERGQNTVKKEPADYLTKDQLAQQLGRSTRTIDRWHTQRIGPRRTKVGNKLVLYRKSAVSEWLERQAEDTASA
jgi:predicted DNA-binding transcriptional regulator AlpA